MQKVKRITKYFLHSGGYLLNKFGNFSYKSLITYQFPEFVNTTGGYHDVSIDSTSGFLCLVGFNKIGRGKIILVDKNKGLRSFLADCPVNYQIGSRCVMLNHRDFPSVISSTFQADCAGKPESTLFGLDGEVIAKFPYDFIDVCESRLEAAAICFQTIKENRPGYGFSRVPTNRALKIIDLRSSRPVLILSIECDFAFLEPSVNAFLNHIKFSPNGRFIFGFISENVPSRKNKCWIFDRDTESFVKGIEWSRFSIVSHHCWVDDNTLLFFGFTEVGSNGYFLLNIETREISDFCSSVRVDGHPTCWQGTVFTDSYASHLGLQSICSIDHEGTRILRRVFTRCSPGNPVRCDTHPKLGSSKKTLYFDQFINFNCSSRALCEISLNG